MSQRKQGQDINNAWSSTSVEKEAELLPDLKKWTIGQGIGWGDIKVYEANGIKVGTAMYEHLFTMVSMGRFDLFPRGISEIGPELETHAKKNKNLAMEKNLLLYYPWPYYFFFNKVDTALQQRIEKGIRKMMADGSFDAIFSKYNSKAILQANIKNRRAINLKNEQLPKETPLNDATLWFDPAHSAIN